MKRTLLAVIAAFVTLAAGIEIFQNQHHSIGEAFAENAPAKVKHGETNFRGAPTSPAHSAA